MNKNERKFGDRPAKGDGWGISMWCVIALLVIALGAMLINELKSHGEISDRIDGKKHTIEAKDETLLGDVVNVIFKDAAKAKITIFINDVQPHESRVKITNMIQMEARSVSSMYTLDDFITKRVQFNKSLDSAFQSHSTTRKFEFFIEDVKFEAIVRDLLKKRLIAYGNKEIAKAEVFISKKHNIINRLEIERNIDRRDAEKRILKINSEIEAEKIRLKLKRQKKFAKAEAEYMKNKILVQLEQVKADSIRLWKQDSLVVALRVKEAEAEVKKAHAFIDSIENVCK